MAEIDVEIDGLTNSVIHTPSGESFPTRIVRWSDLLPTQKTALVRWRFDWFKEAEEGPGEAVGLLVEGRDSDQGIIAFETK